MYSLITTVVINCICNCSVSNLQMKPVEKQFVATNTGLTPPDMNLISSKHSCSFYFQIITLCKCYCLSCLLKLLIFMAGELKNRNEQLKGLQARFEIFYAISKELLDGVYVISRIIKAKHLPQT